MTPHVPGDWKHLAQQASTEMDPNKLMELATELNRVLGEREETSRKQQHPANDSKSRRAFA
jgi:hypothetical protein